MSERCFNCSGQGRSRVPENQRNLSRIRIDVPMGTSYRDIKEEILRQAYELAGTHLRAAIALGITPETVSRILRRGRKKRTSRDGGEPEVRDLMAREVGRIEDPADRAARIARRLSRFSDLYDDEDDRSSKAVGAQDAAPDA